MSTTVQSAGQRGTFADVRNYYCRAAGYGTAYARKADRLSRRDRDVRQTVTAIAAVTSLSIFGSLFVNNPALWAKAVVFLLAAATAILSALRREGKWLQLSKAMRAQGAKWDRQRGQAQMLAARIINGEHIAGHALSELGATDDQLLTSNPALSTHLLQKCEREKTKEFDRDFHL